MFVFIPGPISPVRFGSVGTDPPDGSISPVTYIYTYVTVYKVFQSFCSLEQAFLTQNWIPWTCNRVGVESDQGWQGRPELFHIKPRRLQCDAIKSEQFEN